MTRHPHVQMSGSVGALKRGLRFPEIRIPHIPLLRTVVDFFRKNTVMTVALCAALATTAVVPVDRSVPVPSY